MPLGGLNGVPSPQPVVPPGQTPFAEILREKLEGESGLRFSAHAQHRLKSRNIHLDEASLERLNRAVERADSKGAREALILMNDLAFIVSVDNRTVITAIDSDSMKDSIFTNIDSAVIVK
ncbi:MAG: flagellar protein [Calditrichaeota bacterium]|nr:MAG: flagellar protein [Calditrichota bacterium]